MPFRRSLVNQSRQKPQHSMAKEDSGGTNPGLATLPADSIPNDHADEKDDRESRAPVDRWVAEQEVFDNVVVPAAHTQANVEKRPLPWLGGKVVLHGRMGTCMRPELTSVIDMRLHVPVGVRILWLVFLYASCLNLLEAPLWQVDGTCTEVATKLGVP
ncbi:hypothetical protein KC367_g96 [Hortaea werneckii]|nr:hypothetical protein KC367_g96 [Hortaea werneckii]